MTGEESAFVMAGITKGAAGSCFRWCKATSEGEDTTRDMDPFRSGGDLPFEEGLLGGSQARTMARKSETAFARSAKLLCSSSCAQVNRRDLFSSRDIIPQFRFVRGRDAMPESAVDGSAPPCPSGGAMIVGVDVVLCDVNEGNSIR